MPAHGSAIGTWLLYLAVVEGKPLRAVKEALRAVEYYHSIYNGAAYIDAALNVIAGLGSDDGGGKEEPEPTAKTEARAEDNIVPIPMAAEPSQSLKGNCNDK